MGMLSMKLVDSVMDEEQIDPIKENEEDTIVDETQLSGMQ